MVKATFAFLSVAAASDIPLATFDGAKDTTLKWTQQNDPVMGGKSTGTFTVQDNEGVFDGTCAIVPSLNAPGFIKASTSKTTLPDVSSCSGLALTVKSSNDYDGFRFSFGNKRGDCGKFFAVGHKANFKAPKGEFGTVQIPFTDFTTCWDDATGDAIKTCAQDSKYCPDQATLQNMQTMSVWAEGKEGDVHLEIQSVVATGCSSLSSSMAASASPLVTFDGAEGSTFNFKALNDPVMGGQSTGTWSVSDGVGVLDGEVVDVPSLSAPGFIKAAADGKFPDASSAIGGNLVLTVRSSTPEYAGYRVTFVSGATSASFACSAGGSLPLSRGCFKAKFSVPAGSDFTEIRIPFSDFSDKWSSATGEQTTTCAESTDVCPTASKLSKIQRMEFWGEGAAGKLHLEVKSVSAEDAAGNAVQLV
jgi:hypothetical protein